MITVNIPVTKCIPSLLYYSFSLGIDSFIGNLSFIGKKGRDFNF